MATQTQGITKAQLIKDSNGMYFGEIRLNGKLLEKTGGDTGFWVEDNCINYTNGRVDFWRKVKKVHIPYITRRLQNANA